MDRLTLVIIAYCLVFTAILGFNYGAHRRIHKDRVRRGYKEL